MLEAAFWGVLSASSLLIGAVLALRWRIPPRIVGLVLAFGAGALISAVAFELVEEAIDLAEGTGVVGFGLAIGALTFFGGDWYIDRAGGADRKSTTSEQTEGDPNAIMLGTVLDGVPESIVIGGSLVVGGGISAAMVAAAFMSNLPEALGATAGLKKTGTPARRLMMMWAAIVALSGISAAIGYWVLKDAPDALGAFFQSFAAGAVLTMLTDTMMPEAFEEGGKLAGLFTVLGFALAVWLSTLE
jgi:zinc transporter, ZIP family